MQEDTLTGLYLDVKIEIASKDQQAWYLMYRYDPEFRIFAQSEFGRNMFIRTFTIVATICGRVECRLFGLLNSVDDQPAIIFNDGSRYWYWGDKIHRSPTGIVPLGRDGDRPAIIRSNGGHCWYQNNKLHRDGDRPAIIYADGGQCWYQHGDLHRDGDKPAIIYADVGQCWYRRGELHRDEGKPVVIRADGIEY